MSLSRQEYLFGPTLPTVSPRVPEATRLPQNTDGVGGPHRRWSTILSGFKRLGFQRRQDSSETADSSDSNKTLCTEGENGTLEQVGEQMQSSKEIDDNTIVRPEKPEKGTVWDIWPMIPGNVRRWDKPTSLHIKHVKIPPGPLGISQSAHRMPEGWTMHVHPEGKPYYHRIATDAEDGLLAGTHLYDSGRLLSQPLEIVTDSDPRDPIIRKKLEHAHFIAQVTIAEQDYQLPDRAELFLELYPEEEEDLYPYAGYYIVSHEDQTVFWATETDTDALGALKVNPKTFSDQHLKLQLARQYWKHIECYPLDSSINVPAAQEELVGQITFLNIDVATSCSSTSIWTQAECQAYLSMLERCPSSRKVWVIARLTTEIMNWKFLNYYGHPSARLSRFHSYEIDTEIPTNIESVSSDKMNSDVIVQTPSAASDMLRKKCLAALCPSMALILRVASLLLFDSPATHNISLEMVWADKIVSKIPLNHLREQNLKDWSDISVISTLLWAVNMGFLAVPLPIDARPRPAVQIITITMSLTSTMFAVGSIAIGLIHIRKHRLEKTPEEYCKLLTAQYHPIYGHRLLAILWALPLGLLTWSFLTFFIAMMLFCLSAGGSPQKTLLLLLGSVILSMIAGTVWYFWERDVEWTPTNVGQGEGKLSTKLRVPDLLWGIKPSSKFSCSILNQDEANNDHRETK